MAGVEGARTVPVAIFLLILNRPLEAHDQGANILIERNVFGWRFGAALLTCRHHFVSPYVDLDGITSRYRLYYNKREEKGHFEMLI